MRALLAFLTILLTLTTPVQAGERVTLGFGRLLTNDLIGDRKDRWQTGSAVLTWLRGPEGLTARPEGFGTLLEYRLAASVVAPASLTAPVAGDRRFAGVLSFGVNSHFTVNAYDVSLGVGVTGTGPQTGLGGFHRGLHDALGITAASDAVLASQIPNALYATGSFELARPIVFSDNLQLRPFVAAQTGAESFVRVGGDLMWGRGWGQGLYLRDPVTGQLFQSMSTKPRPGISVLIGADTAKVFNSALLPAADGYQLTNLRSRARLGINVQGARAGVFYGLTWLGREFEAQPEGQVLGALRFSVKF
ncbi:MAG TPA: DUF2219 family protein [Aliiroseovarius sp.]|nr:DUF2219 family protein [Aliiroseovarius sp.]